MTSSEEQPSRVVKQIVDKGPKGQLSAYGEDERSAWIKEALEQPVGRSIELDSATPRTLAEITPQRFLKGSGQVPTYVIDLSDAEGKTSRLELWVKKRFKPVDGKNQIQGSYLAIVGTDTVLADELNEKITKSMGIDLKKASNTQLGEGELRRLRLTTNYLTTADSVGKTLEKYIEPFTKRGFHARIYNQKELFEMGYRQCVLIKDCLAGSLTKDAGTMAAIEDLRMELCGLSRAQPDDTAISANKDFNLVAYANDKSITLMNAVVRVTTKELIPALHVAFEDEFTNRRRNASPDASADLGKLDPDTIKAIIKQIVDEKVYKELKHKVRSILGAAPWVSEADKASEEWKSANASIKELTDNLATALTSYVNKEVATHVFLDDSHDEHERKVR